MKRLLVVAAFLFLLLPNIPLTAQTPNAAAYLNYGNQLYAAKDYTKAVSYYKYATTLDPNNAAAFQGLGSSYYQLGQKPEALAAYQQAKALNPSNTQLDSVIQYLQTQVGSSSNTPPLPGNAAAAGTGLNYKKTSGYTAGKYIEIEPYLGVGVGSSYSESIASGPSTSISYGTGIGGGVVGYYLLDPHLAIGLKLAYLNFNGPSAAATYSYGAYYYSISSTNSFGLIEIAPSIKYKFDGDTIRPYLTASVGFGMLSNSSTDTFNSGNLPSYIVSYVQSLEGSTSASGSQTHTDPMVEIGVGAEYALGPDMSLFLQAEYSMLFDSSSSDNISVSGSFSYLPITAGVNIDF